MANKLPCPNPTCTHEFSPAELQAAAQLACPKCGFRMAGRTAAPAKAPAAVPATVKPKAAAPKPVESPSPKASAPPLAQPVAAPPSLKMAQVTPKSASPPAKIVQAMPVAAPSQSAEAAPVSDNPFALDFAAAKPTVKPAAAQPAAPVDAEESLPEGEFFNPEVTASGGALVRRCGTPKKAFNWMRLLVICLIVGFAVSVVVSAFAGIVWLLPEFQARIAEETGGAIYWYNIRGANGNEKAFKLVMPKDSWEIDKEIQNRFDANAAWKRRDDDLWFAVFVKDYGMQKPRDAVVLKVAVDRLEGHFITDLELATKAEPARFAELPAQKLQFKGQHNSANWNGQCWMFFKDGIAYWVFIASPEWQKVVDFEEEMANRRIFIAVERRGWREQAWPTESFHSENGKIAMTAPKGVWLPGDAKNVDPNAILVLAGIHQDKDNRKNAHLKIFTFEKKDDLKAALAAAREHLDKSLDEENKSYKIVLADDVVKGQTELGIIDDVGDRRGRLIDLKLLFGDEPKRYYLLAVVNDPETAYGIVCDCTWESRQLWRSDFVDILRSARFKK
jgi:hypothetical protein